MFTRFFLLNRQVVSSYSAGSKFSYLRDASWSYNLLSQRGISAASLAAENVSGKAYATFAIFKGKAALMMSPLPAQFTKMDSGNVRVHRKGVVMLKFIPAIGQRKYDSEKKQYFALSTTEVGSLISLGPAESCEFFHDPSMKSSLEGQVKKTLTISPIADSGGYLFNLSILNVLQKTSERFAVPVTKAEFTVMRTACNFALPHIMGWDRVMGPYLQQTGRGLLKQRELNLDPGFEWER